jgi:hypothetical protein
MQLTPRPNLGATGFADLLERLAHTHHREIHFIAQVPENLDLAPPNSEHWAESGATLAQSPTHKLAAFAKILA